MDLIAYLKVFRRRWLLMVLPALAALAVSWMTLPEVAPQTGTPATSYTATATLIQSPDLSQSAQVSPISMSTVTLFTTVGEVPVMAAKALDYDGEPLVLASQIQVLAGSDTNTLTISSTSSSADEVTRIVNAFAGAVIDYFDAEQDKATRDRIRAVSGLLDDTTSQIRQTQADIGEEDDPVLVARITALQSQYTTQFSEIQALNRTLGGVGPLTVLQKAVPIPQTSSGFVAPTNPLARLSIAVLLGIILGAALALVVERIDSRMRTRDQVEESFGLPVLAEIPAQPWTERRSRDVVSMTKPASPGAEAYRALRSSVLLLGPGGGSDQGSGRTVGVRSMMILVTSPLPGEGKTTTVANLAAVMAEAGRTVIVLSLDLRNPRLHEYLGVGNGTGISELLSADRGKHLDQVLRDTDIPRVRIATAGQALSHPGALLASARSMLQAARRLADVVIVDTAPMLTVSDAVDLAPHVDIAIMVSRLNRTTTGQAAAAQRLLARLKIPALGTVLVGSRSAGVHDYRFGARTRGSAYRLDSPVPTDVEQPTVAGQK